MADVSYKKETDADYSSIKMPVEDPDISHADLARKISMASAVIHETKRPVRLNHKTSLTEKISFLSSLCPASPINAVMSHFPLIFGLHIL